jgi:hypothetical protein
MLDSEDVETMRRAAKFSALEVESPYVNGVTGQTLDNSATFHV